MAFLPFYVPSGLSLKFVIVGGGYAGVAALITLRRHCPDAEIVLIDPGERHVKVTHLHETLRRPLEDFLVPFGLLEQRFECRHVQSALVPEPEALKRWQETKMVEAGGETIGFDYLLFTIGVGYKSFKKPECVFGLEDFFTTSGFELLRRCVADKGEPQVTVVGGGATGIQFLFEMARYARLAMPQCRFRLVDAEERVLSQFVPELGRYVVSRMADYGIEYHSATFYRGQEAGKVELQHKDSQECFQLPSDATFLFPGKQPAVVLDTNAGGQILVEGRALKNVFAAGDCAHYHGVGSNALTAQTAVRKGKLAARNMLRHSGRLKVLEPYLHRDLGYVVSLGPDDAVGWVALEANVVAGFPALVLKEVVEAQYDLLLAGIDTYLV